MLMVLVKTRVWAGQLINESTPAPGVLCLHPGALWPLARAVPAVCVFLGYTPCTCVC